MGELRHFPEKEQTRLTRPFPMWELTAMSDQSTLAAAPLLEGDTPGAQVRSLRRELGETGEQFGQRIGLSKGKVSEIENGTYAPSVAVAVEIERLSAGRIDAAGLSEDVKRARAAVHAGDNATSGLPVPNGQSEEMSGQSDQECAA